jgi:hypothetical protein
MESLLAGILAGDGCLEFPDRMKNPFLRLNHCAAQLEWEKWKALQFGSLFRMSMPSRHQDGKGNVSYKISSRAHPCLLPWYELFYCRPEEECSLHIKKKCLNPKILGILHPVQNPLGFAAWLADDGGVGNRKGSPYIYLDLGGLSVNEYETALKWFTDQGFHGKLDSKPHGNCMRIRWGHEVSLKLFSLSKDHLPDCIKFKFHPLT